MLAANWSPCERNGEDEKTRIREIEEMGECEINKPDRERERGRVEERR